MVQTAPQVALGASDPLLSDDAATGSTRLAVDAGDVQAGTVRLRYDATVESVQTELAASGLYSGQVDGVAGKRTWLAIIAYQRRNGLDETGMASPELIEHIRFTRQIGAAASMSAAEIAMTPAAIKRVQASLAELGYRPGAVNGELSQATRSAILRFERDRGIAPTGDISARLLAELGKMGLRASTGTN